jgi:hypothetical protein
MGGGGNQTIEQTFDLSALSESITNTISNTNISMSASLGNQQNLEIDAGDLLEGCKLTIGMTIDSDAISSTTLEETALNQTQTDVESHMTAAAQAAMDKVTEAGNLQFADRQDMEQNVNLAIQNVIENTFETNSLNETINETVNVQDGVIKFGKCIGAEVDITQNITAKLMAEAITKSLRTNIVNNSILNALHAEVSGSQTTENKGLADIIAKFFEGLAGPMKYAIIASVVCCCMLVVLLVVMGLSPAGQKGMSQMSSAGASRLGRRF